MERYVLRHHGTDLRLSLGAILVIGRDSTCDIRVVDKAASRRHARVRVSPDGVWLEDLKSRNGVYLNGQRIERPLQLAPGASFRIGQTRFLLAIADESPADETNVTGFDRVTGDEERANSTTGPLPPMVDDPIDPVQARLDSARKVLAERTRPIADRFAKALGLVQELIDVRADANARLLFGEALDQLVRDKAAGVLSSSTVARAHAYIGRWALQVQSSAAWDARRLALQRAEKLA
jgi:hypothetical protein